MHNFGMPAKASSGNSLVIVVDEQPAFMQSIWEADRVVRRTEFLLRVAALTGVPALATEQNRPRMGGINPVLLPLVQGPMLEKMTFSCLGARDFLLHVNSTGTRQIILVGVETHICVSQTAVDLLNGGFEVMVCPDAVSARTVEMHKIGMERMRDSGVLPIHTEAVAYEWLETAEHPAFREALKLVKEFA
jgi:nicotinamidase-related amidase